MAGAVHPAAGLRMCISHAQGSCSSALPVGAVFYQEAISGRHGGSACKGGLQALLPFPSDVLKGVVTPKTPF